MKFLLVKNYIIKIIIRCVFSRNKIKGVKFISIFNKTAFPKYCFPKFHFLNKKN